MIASGSSRNSQEEPYGSNDMAHNHYLEEARKKTQERNRNSKPSVMHTTSLQNTTNGSKPNPRSNNQISRSLHVSKSSCGMSNGVSLVDHSRNSSSFSDSKHFVCSTCHKYIFNTNHDDCITKILNKVNSRAKVQSPKIRNNNPVEPKNHTHKPGRRNGIGQRFSLNKSSAVHEKPHTPRSYLRWKPTGRIFKTVSLRYDGEENSLPPEPQDEMNRSFIAQNSYRLERETFSKSYRTYPKVHENLKLITDERVIEENPESHSGSMSSMKNLDDTYNFGDQFLYDKPTEDDQEKSKVIEESDSTIPDPSHQTVTSTPPVIAPFTDVSSTKPSSLVTPPPINTEATTITTSLPEITPFISLQLRVARLEQEILEDKID
ncbi:hypothetical protein Tco_0450649 [Tanacetum coccineum]